MDKEQELRPCPLCQAVMVLTETGRWVHPWNDDCPLDSVTIHVKNEAHIAAWNRRSSSDEQAEVVGWRELLVEASIHLEEWPCDDDAYQYEKAMRLCREIDRAMVAADPVAMGGVTEARVEAAAKAIYKLIPNGGYLTRYHGTAVHSNDFRPDPWEDAPDRHEQCRELARAALSPPGKGDGQ